MHASVLTSTMPFLGISAGITVASRLTEALVGPHRRVAMVFIGGFHHTARMIAGVAVLDTIVFSRLRHDRPQCEAESP